MKSFYDELGVAESAPAEVIRAAYKALMRQNHPDTGGDPEAAGRANAAYEVLGDPDRRAAYDQELAAERAAAAATVEAERSAPQATAPAAEPAPIHEIRRFRSHLPYLVAAPVAVAAGAYAAFFDLGERTALVMALATVGMSVVNLKKNVIGLGIGAAALALAVYAGHVPDIVVAVLMLAVSAGFIIVRERQANDRALVLLQTFHQLSEVAGQDGWWILRAEHGPQTTTAMLNHWGDENQTRSATLWGTYPAGVYVVADEQSPATVKMTLTIDDAKRAMRYQKHLERRAR